MADVGFQINGQSATSFSTAANTCNAGLNVAASCTIQVIFTPVSAGPAVATLTITSSTPGLKAPAIVPLSGAGLAPSALTTNPTQLNFAATALGQMSAVQTVTITNPGGMTASGLSLSVSGPFTLAQNTCGSACLRVSELYGRNCIYAAAEGRADRLSGHCFHVDAHRDQRAAKRNRRSLRQRSDLARTGEFRGHRRGRHQQRDHCHDFRIPARPVSLDNFRSYSQRRLYAQRQHVPGHRCQQGSQLHSEHRVLSGEHGRADGHIDSCFKLAGSQCHRAFVGNRGSTLLHPRQVQAARPCRVARTRITASP